MISTAEAETRLRAHVRPAPGAVVPLDAAVGRVLREDVVAERDYPPFDRVTMDGVALASAGWAPGRSFVVAAVQAAGEAPRVLPHAHACIEVMTGAVLPAGCDAVVRREDLRVEGGAVTVAAGVDVRAGQNVHVRGADRAAGAAVLHAGTRLLPPHVAVLASEGRANVRVAARPRVAVLTTGDELVEVGAPVLAHQIRQSNGAAMRAALAQRGYAVAGVAHAPDDAAVLRARIREALRDADVLVLSGGVSAGRFDLVPPALAEAGVREVFHGVRQKPGKPLWFGVAASGQAVFGLPGNPVSALVCLYRYVLPFLSATEGDAPAPATVHLLAVPPRNSDLTRFVPVRVEGGVASALPWNTSGDSLALLPSDGFVEVEPQRTAPGLVPFYPWRAG